VRKVFRALATAVNSSEGRLQIIVLDHADEGVWGEISNVVLTEEWRDKKLVPPWFELPSS
jgi:quinol monooxygenase YgiN